MTSCIDIKNDCIDGIGAVQTQVIDLAPIQGISLDVSFDVQLTEGPTQYVSISSEQNIIDLVLENSEIINDIWHIKLNQACIGASEQKSIKITLPNYRSLSVDGSGRIESSSRHLMAKEGLNLDVNGSGKIILALGDIDELDCEVDGSGRIEVDYGNGNNVNSKVDGSGRIIISGVSKALNASVSSSGRNLLMALATESAIASVSGSGTIEVWPLKSLDASLSGSGDICYKGNPPSINTSLSGSGEITPCQN